MNGESHKPPPRAAITVFCAGCGAVWELGNRAQLLAARQRHAPIFPARCRHCGQRFSDISIAYLRETALAALQRPPEHSLWSIVVPLVPRP